MNDIEHATRKLTRRQRDVFLCLLERARQQGEAPTLQELARELGLSSRGSLHKHIEGLVNAGVVEPTNGLRRGVRLTEPAFSFARRPQGAGERFADTAGQHSEDCTGEDSRVHRPTFHEDARSVQSRSDVGFDTPEPPLVRESSTPGVPLLGRIAAGRPIEALESVERIEVPSWLCTRADCYVLEVKGDSMIDDGIFDGDWVIVEPCETAANGDLVVALVDGDQATLKRIVQRPGEVILMPANSQLAPMPFAPDRVQVQGRVVGQMRSYRS